jgi:hypothetical protein
MLGKLFLPNKRNQLLERNTKIIKEIKTLEKDRRNSILSPRRDTVSEIIYIEELNREKSYNERLLSSLFMWAVLTRFNINPKL